MRQKTNRPRFSCEPLEDRTLLTAGIDLPTEEFFPGTVAPFSTGPTATQYTGSMQQSVQSEISKPTGKGYSVAIIDSGIDYLHPALGGGFGEGFKVIDGWDFVDGRDGEYVEADDIPGPDADPMDERGHGTAMAGLIGANDSRQTGLAPEVNLISLRVLDAEGSGDLRWIHDALQWVIENRDKYNIVAVNMSLGSGNFSEPLEHDFLEAKLKTLHVNGVFIAAAAGNEFFELNSVPGLSHPAISPYVTSVGAVYFDDFGELAYKDGAKDFTTGPDRIASFSQRSDYLDLMAPGAIFTSTALSNGGSANYDRFYGTSLATAFVSAAAALFQETSHEVGRPDFTAPDEIERIFKETGVTIIDGDDEHDNVLNTGMSFQRIDLVAALDYVISFAAQNPHQGNDSGQSPGSPGDGSQQPTDPTSNPIPNPTIPVEPVAPDAFENNDSIDRATGLGWLSFATFTGLSLHSGADTDWYMFAATQAGDYNLEITVPVQNAGIELVLHDVTRGKERRISADVVDGIATIAVRLRDKVNYFLQVSATTENSMPYDLSIQQASSETPERPSASQQQDRHEFNDLFGAASFLGKVETTEISSLTLDSGADVDWYRFQSENRDYKITLNVKGGGEATFTFVDVTKNRERTIQATKTEDGAELTVNLRDFVNYFLVVESSDGNPVDYELHFE